jgi:serine/threonine-protein kinase
VLAQRYRLAERVGGGAMGEVWRGIDQALARTVAVKIVRPELLAEPSFGERFLAEARTMARIRHPGVVAVHDYHSDATVAFLVMEFVAGESLARLLHRSGRLPPDRAMGLVAQAAEALHAAHDTGVVHRDVKPGNLLVTPEGTVVLTDFGIARSAAAAPLTATGVLVGTVAYLAPEQVLGKPATSRSDVYALGVVGYECLAGRRPFEGDHPFELAMKRVHQRPPPLPGTCRRRWWRWWSGRWPPIRTSGGARRPSSAGPPATWPGAGCPVAGSRCPPRAPPSPPVGCRPGCPGRRHRTPRHRTPRHRTPRRRLLATPWRRLLGTAGRRPRDPPRLRRIRSAATRRRRPTTPRPASRRTCWACWG